jgi:hypothetical protein
MPLNQSFTGKDTATVYTAVYEPANAVKQAVYTSGHGPVGRASAPAQARLKQCGVRVIRYLLPVSKMTWH